MTAAPLWQPSRPELTRLGEFLAHAGHDHYEQLHARSVADPEWFWSEAWDFCGLVGYRGTRAMEPATSMRETRFFPDAHLNVVDTLLAGNDDTPAVLFADETGARRALSRRDLASLTSLYEQLMIAHGVGPRDRVAAMMANTPDLCAVMMAAASLGATFTSVSPDFGPPAAVDRLGQVEPTALFAHESYFYAGRRHDVSDKASLIASALPTLQAFVMVPYDGEKLATPAPPGALDGARELSRLAPQQLRRTPLPFDHPWYILYSSGTTGTPKCIVHRAGGVLLKHLVEHQLHCDVRHGDRVLYFTTAGWMMWNWLVSALASGATIVLYDGAPAQPTPTALFDLVDEHEVTLMGVSARYLDGCRKSGLRPRATHDLGSLRTMCSTGSPLAPESFEYVYEAVKPDVHLASISGGTDLCGCLVAGDPTSPVHSGEIQRPALGMAIEVVDDAGRTLGVAERGELTCSLPFPSMPLGFWNDPDGEKYRRAYFERFPGHWHQGDYAECTQHGGMVIHGRSDATLNPGGVRIGTAEIYRQIETMPEVNEALVIGQEWDDDTRVVLFVRLADDVALDDTLRSRIRERIRTGASPRHVPAVVVAVADLPRTRSGKLAELAVRAVVHGRSATNADALANPGSLDLFADLPELR